jgi:hypothetical protein
MDNPMAGDFVLEKGLTLGEWLHQQLSETEYFETEPWALDRVERVLKRLQRARGNREPMAVEIPWLDEVTAFTGPGRYIYFSRRLFERCATDHQVAFVIAHEIAHHDLGHVHIARPTRWMRLPGSAFFDLALHVIRRCFSQPESERDADRYAIDLCLAAGYDGWSCLELFDVLEHHALDMWNADIAYGPDLLDHDAGWLERVHAWLWQRKSGYYSIRCRRQALERHLEIKSALGHFTGNPPPRRPRGRLRFRNTSGTDTFVLIPSSSLPPIPAVESRLRLTGCHGFTKHSAKGEDEKRKPATKKPLQKKLASISSRIATAWERTFGKARRNPSTGSALPRLPARASAAKYAELLKAKRETASQARIAHRLGNLCQTESPIYLDSRSKVARPPMSPKANVAFRSSRPLHPGRRR